MTCDEYQRMASTLIDIELDEASRSLLAGHLSGCQVCRRWQELASRASDDLRGLRPTGPPAWLAASVKARIRSQQATAARPIFPRWLQAPVVAVFVLIAVGVGTVTGNSLSRMLGPDRSEEVVTILGLDRAPSFDELIAKPEPDEGY